MKTIITEKNLPAFAIIRLARAASILAALIFTFQVLPAQAQPSIYVSQNPVLIPAGQTSGTTTLTWDAGGDHPYAEVWQQIDGGEETFVVEQGKGSRQMTIELGKTYVFKLSDFGNLLASVTVTAKNEQPKPPGGGAPGKPPGGIIIKPGNVTDMVANITGDKASPRGSAVEITFWSLPRITPTVEIGKIKPVLANGGWIFPAGQSVGQGSAVVGFSGKKIATSANTFYKFDSTQVNLPPLDPAMTYYYIISVPREDGAGFYQTIGSFGTPSQTVKVVFTSVKIVNDSDPDIDPFPLPRIPVAGEIDLWFWINHGDATAKGYAINNLNNGSALSDHFYDINKEFVIENAPRILTLSVSGSDSDGHRIRNGNFVPAPLTKPQDTGVSEENVANSEWDLTRFQTAPGETYRHVFKLVSLPNGGDKGDLSFEIHGYWEITRPN